MIGGYKYALAAGAMCVVVALSGWGGYRLAAGDCAARELEVARAYVSNQDAAVEAARQQSENAQGRIAKLRRERAEALSRAERLERELASLPHRPDGDFTDRELQALGGLHWGLFASADDPGSVPGEVRSTPGAEQPAVGLRAPDAALGGSVQNPAR